MAWPDRSVVREYQDADDAERAQAYRDAGLDRGRDGEEDDEEPSPRLRPRHHWGLILAAVLLWLAVMALLGVHWWDFDTHGPWLTPITPFVLAGAAERALIRWRPEWDRDHDPGADGGRPARRELGDAARPYWARGGTVEAAGHPEGVLPRDDAAVGPDLDAVGRPPAS